MVNYKLVEVEEMPYIYVLLKCSMDPEDVRETMGKGFADLIDYMQSNSIDFAGPALSVYYSYDEDTVEFRAGYFIKEADMGKVGGDYFTAYTPSGKVLSLTHVGAYSKLRDTYADMMNYIETNDIPLGKPTWEVYVADPNTTAEDELRTDIYVSLVSVSA